MKRFLSLLLSALLLLSCASVSAFAEDSEKKLELVTLPTYFVNSTMADAVEVGFADDEYQIPYISLTKAKEFLDYISAATMNLGCTYTLEHEGSLYTLSRENGSAFYYDADTETVYLSNIMGLRTRAYAVNSGDIVSEMGYSLTEDGQIVTLEDGTPAAHYLSRENTEYNFVRSGYDLGCNLKEQYGIEFFVQDDELYIPVATFNDLFMNGLWLLYNGEAFFLTPSTIDASVPNGDGLTMKDLYYAVEPRARSQKLADFTYHELCMFLDLNYGLAQEHNVGDDGFQSFFESAGLKDDLCSTDSLVFEKTLCDVLLGYMSDRHSTFLSTSSYTGDVGKIVDWDVNNYYSVTSGFALMDTFSDARDAAGLSYTDEDKNNIILEAYSEVGDTAFLTFDSFAYTSVDYYSMSSEELAQVYAQDTVGLVIYANTQINRENSPIRKVVIDLSNNGGGQADSCIYIAAWLLGKARFSVQNPVTKASYSTLYTADVNLDGIAGSEGDSLDLNKLDVYCLISGNSFSCGNLLPCMIKEDGRITLIGQTSGGGACTVQFAATADGSLYRCSSFYKLCTIKNGAFYSIDQGADPDIPLRKVSSFYDREWLVSYLDTIK